VEATLLAWASWAATTSLFSPINKGKRTEQKCSALLVLRNLSKLVEKKFREKNPSRGAFVTLLRHFRKRFCGDSSPFFTVLHRSSFVLRSSTGKFPKSNLSIHSMHP